MVVEYMSEQTSKTPSGSYGLSWGIRPLSHPELIAHILQISYLSQAQNRR